MVRDQKVTGTDPFELLEHVGVHRGQEESREREPGRDSSDRERNSHRWVIVEAIGRQCRGPHTGERGW